MPQFPSFIYRAAKFFAPEQFSGYLEARAIGMAGLAAQRASVWASEGNPELGAVALTFDDGPVPGVTDKILDALDAADVKATFFQVGVAVQSAPELTARAAAQGHEIGNHTFSHVRCAFLEQEALALELEGCSDVIERVTGARPAWYRPPFSSLRESQAFVAEKKGLRIAFWGPNPKDWKQPGTDTIVRRVAASLRPGAILVMHDKHPQTAEAVPLILDLMRLRRLRSVTFSQIVA
jgi:peptidoglycan/xylan/chitin deacetylase (PgdA/CDA1 family)